MMRQRQKEEKKEKEPRHFRHDIVEGRLKARCGRLSDRVPYHHEIFSQSNLQGEEIGNEEKWRM